MNVFSKPVSVVVDVSHVSVCCNLQCQARITLIKSLSHIQPAHKNLPLNIFWSVCLSLLPEQMSSPRYWEKICELIMSDVHSI